MNKFFESWNFQKGIKNNDFRTPQYFQVENAEGLFFEHKS